MQIKQVTAIILMGLFTPLALVGAEDLYSPYPQNVRVNINVAEMAELSLTEETIYLHDEGGSVTGGSAVGAQANFDYQIRTEYIPWPTWSHETLVTNNIDGIHDALYVASGSLEVSATLAQGTATGSATGTAAPVAASASAGIMYNGNSVGIVTVTLTHAP